MAVQVESVTTEGEVLHGLSTCQAAFFLVYGSTIVFWLLSEYLNWAPSKREFTPVATDEEMQQLSVKPVDSGPTQAAEAVTKSAMELPHTRLNATGGADSIADVKRDAAGDTSPVALNRNKCRPTGPFSEMASSPLARVLLLDRNAIKAQRQNFRSMVEFGTLLVWYFLCDRTSVLGASGKTYSRDLFFFLFGLLTVVAGMTSLSSVKAPVFLVRQQTEEWKGWMQVLFLLYHYFEAKEAYNAIRIFIAGYVWMTGFGNFIYYYKTGDFSVGRFAQMMWRLNFLVFFACVILQNSYMLYYICPMHTLFTLMVYACLGMASHLNQSPMWLVIKMLICWIAVMILWHKPVFYAIWSPFTWLVGYMDPRKPADQDIMHEWFFRSSLDRYVWIYGMICGMAQPFVQNALTVLDTYPRITQVMIRSGIVSVCAVVGYVWWATVFVLPRNDYNALHPYTSWIPITLWAILRNLTPTLRLHHLRLYGWLGCITLETYICQFHIWMRTALPNGQPKELLVLVPGYPLINFAIVTAGYVFVSFRLFELTNALKTALIPHSNNMLLLRNCLLMGVLGGVVYMLAMALNPMLSMVKTSMRA